MTSFSHLSINAERLTSFLNEMALIGATPNGGCNRQALTNLDHIGRELFLQWCTEIGGVIRRDTMGNLFIHWEGQDPQLAPVLMGSHLDTQPTGGKYDGVYGVLSALEVMKTLREQGILTKHPIEIAVWTNEEGARFAPAMMGSGVFAGVFDEATIHESTDSNGISVATALRTSGEIGDEPCKHFPIAAALELHIEQGPVLEAKELPIGIVTGVQGMNWYTVTLQGETTHAGPTPMSMRKDPVKTMSLLIHQLYQLVEQFDDQAKVTVGDLSVLPGSRNTVPHTACFTVDLRHPQQEQLSALCEAFKMLCHKFDGDIKVSVDTVWQSPAVQFHPTCIEAVRKSCQIMNAAAMDIVSGAGHDSVYLSRIAPVGMIFIPCKNGISHNEKESIQQEHAALGANVLLQSLLQLAKVSEMKEQ